MSQASVAKATLSRLPMYLNYLRSLPDEDHPTISATTIAKALELGEVQVRKDLSAVSGEGKPKIGYVTSELISRLENFLGLNDRSNAVIVGAGKLGRGLLDYDGFADYGLDIVAAFDCDNSKIGKFGTEKIIYPMDQFESFCKKANVRIGIITVPEKSAQKVCDMMVYCGIKAIWSFAPCNLTVPDDILLQQENLALSLAYLNEQIKTDKHILA